jgi:hypothetical protein
VLAKGAQLTFTGRPTVLGGDEPNSGEFFLDNTQAVPVARATARATVPPPPQVAPAPPNESRRARRRRLGIPRRITIRVILFVILVAAIPTGAYFFIRWYAYDNWFLSVQRHEVVVLQGHPGGVLWFDPRVVDHTGARTSHLPASGVSEIRAGVQEPSLKAANVANLQSEYATAVAAKKAESKANTPTSTTTSLPNTSLPNSSTTTAVVPTTPPPVTVAP